ncbi:MAG TPA: histidinol-phosphatase [Geminicoccaceae bacterium]|nr:histidinol-phosphatase [Geminicoccaceae bacterium]
MSAAAPSAAELAAFAHQLADVAAAVVRRYYRVAVPVEAKLDASPVTIADREAERAMRDLIQAHYPDHGIEGEEFGVEGEGAEFVWHLDPIDGTKSFITGRPQFGTLVGLSRAGRPVLGIIDQCILRERWVGLSGQGSSWNSTPIRVRPCSGLELAVLYATSPLMFAAGAERAAFERVQRAVRYPLFGGDCYVYGLLAMGFVDVIVEADLDAHDFMALVPVVEGAGGVMTDWQGRPLNAASDGRVVAAGDPRVHEGVLKLLASGGH